MNRIRMLQKWTDGQTDIQTTRIIKKKYEERERRIKGPQRRRIIGT